MVVRLLWIPALACAAALHSISAQRPQDPITFATTLGRDTVALERYQRTNRRLAGDIVLRVPTTVLFRYVIDLRADGSLARPRVELRALRNDHPRRVVTIDYRGDSARVVTDSAGVRDSVMRATPSPLVPALTTGFGSSFGIYTSIGMLQASLPRLTTLPDPTSLSAMGALSGRVAPRFFVRRSATRVDVDYFRIAWIHLTLDATGQIMSVDATETTERTLAVRTPLTNVEAAAKQFADRDAAGRGLGIASPADSAQAIVGATPVFVLYSSPRLRARAILGATVPYDQVWRTGANAATALRTGHELMVGDTRLPPGSYTLWTLPMRNGVTLIINRQHGQWGTEYDPSRDVARIAMYTSRVGTEREDFAIELTASGQRGELRIAWADFVWSVPLREP